MQNYTIFNSDDYFIYAVVLCPQCSVQNAIFSKSLHCLAIDAISINRITNTLYYINVVKRLYYMINSVVCVCVLDYFTMNKPECYNNRLWPFSFGSNILCTSKYVVWSYILHTIKQACLIIEFLCNRRKKTLCIVSLPKTF